jgi:hypothetical protein
VDVAVVGVVDDVDIDFVGELTVVVIDEVSLPCLELVEVEPGRLVVEAVVEFIF